MGRQHPQNTCVFTGRGESALGMDDGYVVLIFVRGAKENPQITHLFP